ncbi:hypothetical protein E0U70_20115 [Salmonella enterica subsp. enterica serovar Gloucester]|nr:hypothetical protein [Salmonella enterica subsp. enterica serovar Gloucester]
MMNIVKVYNTLKSSLSDAGLFITESQKQVQAGQQYILRVNNVAEDIDNSQYSSSNNKITFDVSVTGYDMTLNDSIMDQCINIITGDEFEKDLGFIIGSICSTGSALSIDTKSNDNLSSILNTFEITYIERRGNNDIRFELPRII